MNKLFPLPIYTFLKIASENGGYSARRIKNILPWLVKTIIFEPFRWIEIASQNKKIYHHKIRKDPVFILGFYRSGTSYLHHFLTQDDRFGYHTNFQMVFPEIMLTCEKWLSPFFEFIFNVFHSHDPIHRMPLSFRFPGEEDGTMTTALEPRGASWGYFFPKKMIKYFRKYVLFENLPENEIKAWTQSYLFLLKKISLASNGKQLVLKSPPNTARIKLLLSIFPQAKFILIHRNPYDVYASNKRFIKVTHSFYAVGPTRSVDINSIILETYAMTMNRYLSEKDLIPQQQLVEVAYDDFISAPLESIKKIYEKLELNDFSYCENTMKKFANKQRKFVKLQHQLPSDEKQMVANKLGNIIRYWNYSFL